MAVGIGGLAVAVLTVDYGHLPYIALLLAASFGSYGLVKKLAGTAKKTQPSAAQKKADAAQKGKDSGSNRTARALAKSAKKVDKK